MLRPIPGSPEGVLALTTSLTSGAARLSAIAAVLAGIRQHARWDGEAGRAFGARVAQAPPLLDHVVHRYAGAAAALRALAPVLEEAQAVASRAVHDHDEAERAYAVLEDRAYALLDGGEREESLVVAAVRRAQIEQMRLRQRAEADHRSAWMRFHEADRRCAAALRTVAQDAMVDSLTYRALTTTSAVGSGAAQVGLVVPPLRPYAAVAGSVGAVADGVLLLGYGDGDVAAVAASTALAGTGVAGKVMQRGAVAGTATRGGAVPARTLTQQQRLREGASAVVRDKRRSLVEPFRTTPPAKVPTSFGGAGTRAAASGGSRAARTAAAVRAAPERARAAAVRQLDKKVLDDWRTATKNGPGAQEMFVVGSTLRVTQKASAKAAGALAPPSPVPRRDLSLGACPSPPSPAAGDGGGQVTPGRGPARDSQGRSTR